MLWYRSRWRINRLLISALWCHMSSNRAPWCGTSTGIVWTCMDKLSWPKAKSQMEPLAQGPWSKFILGSRSPWVVQAHGHALDDFESIPPPHAAMHLVFIKSHEFSVTFGWDPIKSTRSISRRPTCIFPINYLWDKALHWREPSMTGLKKSTATSSRS